MGEQQQHSHQDEAATEHDVQHPLTPFGAGETSQRASQGREPEPHHQDVHSNTRDPDDHVLQSCSAGGIDEWRDEGQEKPKPGTTGVKYEA